MIHYLTRSRLAPALLLALGALFHSATDAAEMSPVGLWKTIDDETGKAKSVVRISEANGELQGKVEKVFSPPAKDPNPMCDECEGERKGKPVIGMTILWGLKKTGDNEWTGGQILDPAKGKIYKSKLSLAEEGRKLQMRGFIGFSLIGRTQTWVREE
jgi:uncharacterized protein (DUF2147 family)